MFFWCITFDYNWRMITAYIHLIGAGHLTHYVRKYRHLGKFTQQGWEALIQLIKIYYFRNTNNGGCGGNRHGNLARGDHFLPIMQLVQRRMMWLLGLGQQYFEHDFDTPIPLLPSVLNGFIVTAENGDGDTLAEGNGVL